MSKAEKFIQDYTRNCSNLMQVPTLDDKGNIVPEAHPWLTPGQARRAVEIAREEVIEKALAYLNEKFYFNNLHYSVENNTFNCMEEMYEDFRKYMED